VLTTWVVIPLVESVEAGREILEVPSVSTVTSEPLGAFKFGPLPLVETHLLSLLRLHLYL